MTALPVTTDKGGDSDPTSSQAQGSFKPVLVPVAYVSGMNLGADASLISVHVRGVPVEASLVDLVLPHSKIRIVLPALSGQVLSSSSSAQRADCAEAEVGGAPALLVAPVSLLLSDIRVSVCGLESSFTQVPGPGT